MIVTWSKRAAAFHVRRRKMFRPVFVVWQSCLHDDRNVRNNGRIFSRRDHGGWIGAARLGGPAARGWADIQVWGFDPSSS